MGDAAIRLVGCVEVGHDGFKAEWGQWVEPGENVVKRGGVCALAAHASVNLEMDGQRARLKARGTGRIDELVELPGLPCDGSEPVLDDRVGLAGKDTGDDQNLRGRAECAGGDTFFHAGDAEPLRAGP